MTVLCSIREFKYSEMDWTRAITRLIREGRISLIISMYVFLDVCILQI